MNQFKCLHLLTRFTNEAFKDREWFEGTIKGLEKIKTALKGEPDGRLSSDLPAQLQALTEASLSCDDLSPAVRWPGRPPRVVGAGAVLQASGRADNHRLMIKKRRPTQFGPCQKLCFSLKWCLFFLESSRKMPKEK